ncbi:hypothetical protein GCM10025880_01580 [Methylorubrum aminovorans]|nr:hypothetical protein GCM10025880_01580 [Methylorubrum aminovorans]
MGGHLDRDLSGVQGRDHALAVGRIEAGKHQLGIGVFVVDHEQAAAALGIERDESDEVVVVAELALLGRGTLLLRVEGGGVGKQRVAPAQQGLRLVALGHVQVLIDAGREFREVEGGTVRGGGGGLRRDSGGERGGKRAAHQVAPGEAVRDHRVEGRGVGQVGHRCASRQPVRGGATIPSDVASMTPQPLDVWGSNEAAPTGEQ